MKKKLIIIYSKCVSIRSYSAFKGYASYYNGIYSLSGCTIFFHIFSYSRTPWYL